MFWLCFLGDLNWTAVFLPFLFIYRFKMLNPVKFKFKSCEFVAQMSHSFADPFIWAFIMGNLISQILIILLLFVNKNTERFYYLGNLWNPDLDGWCCITLWFLNRKRSDLNLASNERHACFLLSTQGDKLCLKKSLLVVYVLSLHSSEIALDWACDCCVCVMFPHTKTTFLCVCVYCFVCLRLPL